MNMQRFLILLASASALCLTAFSAFGISPSLAAGTDNWTMPYNQFWGNSSAGTNYNLTGCAVAWGKSICGATNNSYGLCATSWGNSSCAALVK